MNVFSFNTKEFQLVPFVLYYSIIFPANNSADWSHIENITLDSEHVDKLIIFEKIQNVSQFQNTKIPYIPPGL